MDVPLRLIDGQLLVLNREGVLLSLDPETGHVHWHREVGRSRTPPVAADSEHLLVATMDSLFLVDRKSGFITGRERAPGELASAWIEHGQEVLAATADSAIVAVDRTTLRTIWRRQVDAPTLATPDIRGDTLYVVTRIGTIYRVLLGDDPTLEQVIALALPVTADPILMGDWLLVGGGDGAVHAIDAGGSEIWSMHLGRPVEVAPLVVNDSTLYGVGGQGQLSRFHL